jgi:hypothetical protein
MPITGTFTAKNKKTELGSMNAVLYEIRLEFDPQIRINQLNENPNNGPVILLK